MFPDRIFYEPDSLQFELGRALKDRYPDVPWVPIDNHEQYPAAARILQQGISAAETLYDRRHTKDA